MNDIEISFAVLEPHFEAVRDVFSSYEVEPHIKMEKIHSVKMIIDPAIRDVERHHAACRDDGSMILFSPQAAFLNLETLVAIIAHEFGHAADHLYPGCWLITKNGRGENEATWIGDCDSKYHRKYRNLWHQRNRDQIEWSADAIASKVVGKRITYCGPCLLQCFSGGIERPEGLR